MSKTKRNISDKALNEIFSKHSLGKIVKVIPLKGGQFNSVLKITVQSGKNYVIKIAPSKETDVLTYEKDLIKSEVYFYEKFSSLKTRSLRLKMRLPIFISAAQLHFLTDTFVHSVILLMRLVCAALLTD